MFKTWPKIKGEISFSLGRKSPKFEKYADFKPFKPHLIYCTAHVAAKMRYGVVRSWFQFWLNSKP